MVLQIDNDFQYHKTRDQPPFTGRVGRDDAVKASRKDSIMFKRTGRIMITAVAVLLAGAAMAQADQRGYVWTYDYSTLASDSAEMELYQTAVTRDRKTSDASDWKQQVEIEYGLTDHLDVALYQVYEQPAGGVFTYEGYKVRLRYRLAERNSLPVDVLLYVEHIESTTDASEFEGKLVLAKDFGKLNIAYNQVFEKKYESGSRAEYTYAAGICYEVASAFRLGVESKGNFRDHTYAAGPTIAWTGGRIWANIGAVFGLNDKTKDREARIIMGIPF